MTAILNIRAMEFLYSMTPIPCMTIIDFAISVTP